MSEHRCESNQVDPGHGSASRPRLAKIIESKVWNRTLVCFRSDPVDSRQRARVRGVYLYDRLVCCATGKNKIAWHLLKPSSQSAQAFSVSGTLRAAAFVFPNGLRDAHRR